MEERERFLARLLSDATLREELEDLPDLDLARQRASEPVRPLAAVLAEEDDNECIAVRCD